jgi:hypothetical protein
MPAVTGLTLDVALSDIERAGFDQDVEVLGGGVLGILDKSNWQVCEQSPASGQAVAAAPRLTVDRSCGGSTPEPSESPSEEPTPDPDESEPEAETYAYEGPQYEIVTVEEDMGPAELSQYWVVTSKFDYSTDAYKDQIKLMITDIARDAKTANLIVEVVTDKKIAAAEAASTYESFVAEYGEDYARNTIPKKEKEGWAASYTGGYDSSTNEASDSDDAFEVVWRPASDSPEFENWKPQAASS